MLKPLMPIALLFCGFVTSHLEAHFLWKVETDTPSFLYGTIHSSNPEVSEIPAVVMESLRQSDSFHPEIEFSPENIGRITAMMFAGGSSNLESELPEGLWKRTVEAGARIGIPAALLRRLSIQIAPMLFATPPNADFNEIIDIQLYEAAKQADLKITSLETVEEQMAIFENLTHEEAVIFLKETLDEFENGFPSLTQTINLYAAGDVDALHEFLLQELNRSGSPELLDALLYDRNVNMAEGLLPYLQKGGAFAAVGVGHMPGDKGLIALLEKEGFTITPLLPATKADAATGP